jgi:hypothetical protein
VGNCVGEFVYKQDCLPTSLSASESVKPQSEPLHRTHCDASHRNQPSNRTRQARQHGWECFGRPADSRIERTHCTHDGRELTSSSTTVMSRPSDAARRLSSAPPSQLICQTIHAINTIVQQHRKVYTGWLRL